MKTFHLLLKQFLKKTMKNHITYAKHLINEIYDEVESGNELKAYY